MRILTRRRPSKLASGLIAITVATGLIGSGGPVAAQPEPTASPGSAPDHHIVTLITGDRIGLTGNRVAVYPRPDRTNIGFLTQRRGDHVHVIPADAIPLLRDGRLDPRLFDITELVRFGYADTRNDLPLIVSFTGAGIAARSATPSVPGASVVHDLPAIDGQAVRLAKAEAAQLWDSLAGSVGARSLGPAIAKVWLDGLRTPLLDVSVPQIGAPDAWADGYDGTGQVVAVLDTGIDDSHPDLAGQVIGRANFTEGEEDDRDLAGHGTHVASTIAGTGAASGGQFRGVAPGARLLDGKVCMIYGCAESWILAGMQWAVDQGASVINLSLGGADTPDVDPLEQAVQTLSEEHDVLFVIAAGNLGGVGTISSPASADAALAVGAVDDTGELAWFSSQGPRAGDEAIKPDITAPGVAISAARSKDLEIGIPYEPYIAADGTSMATPHVAGAAAILAQRHPDWGGAQLKAALMASAVPHPTLTPFAQGAGRVDVARAIEQSVVTTTSSVSFGRAVWPHDDDPVLEQSVTYRNLGSTDVTLALALATTGPDGQSAPTDMFGVSATSVTVPAGGTASVTLTADTRAGSVDGLFGGRLVATADDVVVQTPFAVNREPESYDLTIVHIGQSGEPSASYHTMLFRLDEFAFYDVYDPDGTATVRLPKAEYLMTSVHFTEDGMAMLAQPRLELTGDRTIESDVRLAQPVEITVPKAEASGMLEVGIVATTEILTLDISASTIGAGTGLATAGLPADGPTPYVRSYAHGELFQTDEFGFPSPTSPYAFHVGSFTDGQLFTGLQQNLTWRDFATVQAKHAAGPEGVQAGKAVWLAPPGGDPVGTALVTLRDLPLIWTEYYAGDVFWEREFDELRESDMSLEFYSYALDPLEQFRAGETSTETWNLAVFSPGLPEYRFVDSWASRLGDTLLFYPPLHSDSAGRMRAQAGVDATFTVTRNGTVIGTQPGGVVLDVPPGKARYGITVVADLASPWTLSTHLEASWTFESSHVDGMQALPVSMVRFAPPVNLNNAVPAGGRIEVPVSVVTEAGAQTPRNKRLTVEVSFDDGQSWRHVPVVPRSGQKVAMINHARNPGFVSLRATAEDVKGNTTAITVIRAFRLS